MSKVFDEVKDYLPQLRGMLDARVENILYLAFLRVYEYVNAKVELINKQAEITTRENINRTTELVNNFATELITKSGSGNNPLQTLGSGAVTSVAATGNVLFSVSGSPITESGTLGFVLNNQTANRILAGPTSGGASSPTFRSLVKEDINIPFKLTTTTNADPTVAEYSAGTWGVHLNTTSGNVYLAYNNSGTILKLQLV